MPLRILQLVLPTTLFETCRTVHAGSPKIETDFADEGVPERLICWRKWNPPSIIMPKAMPA